MLEQVVAQVQVAAAAAAAAAASTPRRLAVTSLSIVFVIILGRARAGQRPSHSSQVRVRPSLSQRRKVVKKNVLCDFK